MLFWPGDELAGDVFTERSFLDALVAVEGAWARALVDAGVAPRPAAVDPAGLVHDDDPHLVAVAAGAGGNPVIPLVATLRARLAARGDTDAARWLHRGLTSQDVLDTALVLLARDARTALAPDLRRAVAALTDLAERHRATPMTGRTLTQPAVPIRFGAKVAGWLQGVLDAVDDLDRLALPVQVGGAAGTLSGVVVLTRGDTAAATGLVSRFAADLQLTAGPPWHTSRAPVTRIGEAFARVTAACGRIGNDVLTLSRPELGELAEGTGGGSSTMPHKANPLLSTLIRRAALTAPAPLSLLHLAAADTGDERPAGAWHLEWQPLQLLARHTCTATAQTAALVENLQVDTGRMAANLAAAGGVDAEAAALGELVGGVPPWAGADDVLVDAALARAATWQGHAS